MKLELGDIVIVTDDSYRKNIGKIGTLLLISKEGSPTNHPFYVRFVGEELDIEWVRAVAPATGLMKALA